MIVSALGFISITEGAVYGVIMVLLLRSISIQEAYQSINWTVIFLLAALVPFNIAITKTGAHEYIGNMIIDLANLFSGFAGASDFIIYLSYLYHF